MRILSKRLKKAMEDKNISVVALAKKINRTPNTIRLLLNSEDANPTTSVLLAICEILQITPNDLLLDKEPVEQSNASEDAYDVYVQNLKDQYFSVRKELEAYKDLVSTLNERVKQLESNIEQLTEKSKSAKKDKAAGASPSNSDVQKKYKEKRRTSVAHSNLFGGLTA